MTPARRLMREILLGMAALAAPAGFVLLPADDDAGPAEDDAPEQPPSGRGMADPDRPTVPPSDRRPT
jgi:hypothetical protein